MRGRGLLIGVDFGEDRVTKKPAEAAATAITQPCLERGLFMQPLRQRGQYFIWRIAPPLPISYAEIDRALEVVEESIRAVCGGA